jgi:hypothetical protein
MTIARHIDYLLGPVLAVGLAVFAATGQQPRAPDPIAPTSARRVLIERVHDADTVFGAIDLGYGLSLNVHGGIRAADFDAWEVGRQREQVVGPISDEELRKGRIARDALINLLVGNQLWAEDSGDTDPHGRNSSILWIKQGDKWIYLAGWMDQQGHLRTPRK